MEKQSFDLVVLGSGPGGYVAAIRGAQQGLKVALVEAAELGGVCLNRGCIPSKTLIANANLYAKMCDAEKFGIHVSGLKFDYAQMKERKDGVVTNIRKGLEGLIKSNKIQIIQGYGKFISPHEMKVNGIDNVVLEAKNFIIASGSVPRTLAHIPFDYERIHDSTSILNLTKLPKSIAIVGGGVIGCEFASMHRAFGVEVSIFEMLPNILPQEGKNVSNLLLSSFKKRGINVHLEAKITEIKKESDHLKVCLEDRSEREFEMALISVGRKFNTDNIGIENTGVIVEPNGTIPTDARLRTNVPHIYAIGDITGLWILAHVASHQGLVAADNCAGHRSYINYAAVPSVIFTSPEIGSLGFTLEQAIEKGYDATIGKFPFSALGKSQATMETEGFAQVVIDKKTEEILGAQVVGYGAANLIAELALAINNELTVHSITETIHAHPTTAEAWLEAALDSVGDPIHMPPKGKASGQ
jgi:dihydrolipoamide dehydrogenase